MYCPDYDCEKRLEDIKRELKAEKALRRIKINKYKSRIAELKEYADEQEVNANRLLEALQQSGDKVRELFALLNTYSSPSKDYEIVVGTWSAAFHKIRSLIEIVKHCEKE